MNIYFFLNHLNLDSSLDIFNFPPNTKFCNDVLKDIYPYAFFSNGREWEYISLNKIKKNDSFVIKKSDLPRCFHDKSIFLSFSLEPNDFKKLKIEVENCWNSIGKIVYGPTKDDKKNLKFKRSIYFIKNNKKNHILTNEDIKIVRPNNGIEPKYLEKIIGKRLYKNIKKNTPVKIKDFKF